MRPVALLTRSFSRATCSGEIGSGVRITAQAVVVPRCDPRVRSARRAPGNFATSPASVFLMPVSKTDQAIVPLECHGQVNCQNDSSTG